MCLQRGQSGGPLPGAAVGASQPGRGGVVGPVGDILQEGLTRYQQCQEEGQGFLLQPASLSVTGETREEWEEGIEGKDYQKKTIKRKGEVFMDICWNNQV